MRTLSEALAVRQGGSPGAWSAAAQYGNWVAVTGYRRALFVFSAGELDADLPVAIHEATDSAGSGGQAITGLAGTFVNGTDEGHVGIIEVLMDDMSDGFDYLAARVTPGAADGFSCVVLLGEPIALPVSNTAADGVSFNDSLA